MRRKIYDVLENDSNKLNDLYDGLMILTIIVSIVPLLFKENNTAFKVLDYVCVCIFVLDYILRLITADYKYQKKSFTSFVKYPFSFLAIVDIISILPTFLAINQGFKVLRIFRMLKAMKVLRVLKVVRYSKTIRIIMNVLKKAKEPLIAVVVFAIAYILVSALVVFNVEPDTFDSFFDAVYWATISLTTVGYGDIYPVTVAGRIVTMVSSLFGIAIVALPAGIITAGYMSEINKN